MRLVGTGSDARAIALGLGAAATFGASVPFTKLLAAGTDPLVLAGLLYLGAGGALAILRVVRTSAEPALRSGDLWRLAAIVAAGAVAGPALLVAGLRRLPGVPAALLLNLEAPLTALLAVVLFGEHLSRRGALASGLLGAGAVALAVRPGALRFDGLGVLALVGACAAWAVDSNLTQQLSLRDPVALVRFKGLSGGACMVLLALALGRPFPRASTTLAALAIGAIGYGASIVWHVRAMRQLGAARQSALSATAPFAGALLSLPLLGERLGAADLLGAALMAAGVALLVRERHAHLHVHEPLEHEHLHVHDEHHQHAHDGPVSEPHTHPHRHERLEHSHPHASDPHHRHKH